MIDQSLVAGFARIQPGNARLNSCEFSCRYVISLRLPDRRSTTAQRCDATVESCRARATAATAIQRPVGHGGFSLLEMLVVLAILAAVAAWTWPALRRQLSASELREAGKQVRAELARARHKAVKTSTVQQFRFQPGRRVFEVSTLPSTEESPQAPSDLALDDDNDPSTGLGGLMAGPDQEGAERHELPDGTYFASALTETAEDPDAAMDAWASVGAAPTDDDIGTLPGNSDVLPGDSDTLPGDSDTLAGADVWSHPIVFYPNGQTSSARIRLANAQGAHLDVTLRGLTGVATVGRLRRGKVQR